MPQSIFSFIIAWYNLPFTILLVVCILLAAMQWIGLGGDHDSDADGHIDTDFSHDLDLHADADGDFDGDLDGDVDADFHADLDGDLDHDVDLHAELDSELDGDAHLEVHPGGMETGHPDAGGGLAILAYLGVGRAPLMILLLLLFSSVGLLGWVFNGLTLSIFPVYPGLIFGVVFLAALAGGSYISSRLARVIGRTLPPISTTATPALAMVGRRGTVISPFVDHKYGMVHLRDKAGTLISVFAITDEEIPIKRGEEVILVHYDQEKKLYEVIRSSL